MTVELEKLNWDEECHKDFITGKGFRITEPGLKKKKKQPNGIYSHRFATDWDDDFSFAERYSCDCKELKGKLFEGETCPNCNTKVRFIDVDMDMTGWIILEKGFIIQPTIYKKLEVLIGPEVLADIITEEKDITVLSSSKADSPYSKIGMFEFKERYFEILEYFYKKKKKKDLYEELKADYPLTFVKSIPVFSTVIRPLKIKNDEMKWSSFNKIYTLIFSLVKKINSLVVVKRNKEEKYNIEITIALAKLQSKINALWDEIFNYINSKEGHIKGKMLGGRINFTARNVIIPDPSLKADELILCYYSMMELYKFEIIAHLVKIFDISEIEAHSQWQWATINFDNRIYELIQYIIKKQKPHVIINRPPTINFGSILCMKIKDVKVGKPGDFTMSLPLRILPVLNGDFDGDNLTIVSLKTKQLIREYDRVFNPRKSMYISRNDGLFNEDFNLFKDQIIGLYEFNNVD
ncbi:hypothetical protein [Romboutsia ilealis]|uniref:hypothetical protein n=1 Tax=Romboutsia ilealis TaxID=1115758 RepID=UPI00259D271C|nr:hypothetical protein [Romboutsia ilealis]